jgi:hypothetical protein
MGYAVPPGYAAQPYGPYIYVPVRRTNGMAIASLVVSIASFVVCPFVSVVGLVLGYKARTEIRERDEDGDGLALAGIITGWVGVGYAVLWILFIAFFITIPFWAPTE